MSGNGGDGPPGNGNGVDCSTLIFKTVLNSPSPSVLASLEEGVLLSVVQQERRVLAVTAGGAVAGAITSGQLPKLIACLHQGNRYMARVLSLNQGRCEVEVRPATPEL